MIIGETFVWFQEYEMYDFSKKEIDYIYSKNPFWRDLEIKLYGDLYGD